jgi:hypothetical protein
MGGTHGAKAASAARAPAPQQWRKLRHWPGPRWGRRFCEAPETALAAAPLSFRIGSQYIKDIKDIKEEV